MSQQVIQLGGSKNRLEQVRCGKKLEYFTIIYNSLEGLIALIAGLLAGSIALVGFGFDSVIEVTSGAVLLWRLSADMNEAQRERVEKLSLKLVGVCFIALTLYIGYDSITSLWLKEAPARSLPGILLAIASLLIMPWLAKEKRKVAASIKSSALIADARQTEFCTYLSAILLGGLLLNAVLGWWWADPLAALIMVPIIIKEGIEALKGKTCCAEGSCH